MSGLQNTKMYTNTYILEYPVSWKRNKHGVSGAQFKSPLIFTSFHSPVPSVGLPFLFCNLIHVPQLGHKKSLELGIN